MGPDWNAKAESVPYVKFPSPQALNLYSYVENNPITGMDPDGYYLACQSAESALIVMQYPSGSRSENSLV